MAWCLRCVSTVRLFIQQIHRKSADDGSGYDAGIMTVILADPQFTEYYNMTPNRQGIVSTAPWATTGLAQIFIGGTLASLVGRVWALRISIVFMCLGV